MGTRPLLTAIGIVLLASLPCSAPLPSWQGYAFRDGAFVALPAPSPHPPTLTHYPLPPLPATPPDWHVAASTLADVTRDGAQEWVLLVWRPWRDWPIQRWLPVPSPIADFHDVAGESCHLILLDPRNGREVWAGSALPVPLLALAVGDVNGDGWNELVTLEGDYISGRDGPAAHVDIWRWNGFGFTMEWRSPPVTRHQLRLTDADNDGILDIVVR